MSPFPNLISDSVLVNDTIDLLRASGGNASAVEIVDSVMKIASPDPQLADMLVGDLIETDPRLQLNNGQVQFIEGNGNRQLSEAEYVVFDFETTGAKTPPCRVTEIGAFRVSKGEIGESFHSLVNPEMPIPAFITSLTSIDDAMVENAPKFAEIAKDFLEFVGDAVLVAHNAMFDMRFLNVEIGRIHINYRVANPYLCTVRLARKLIPEIENHKLATVANYYSINLDNHHRATDDAKATSLIFLKLLDLLEEKGVEDLSTAMKGRF
ncbi:MAG: exonuclease domain-containing protein [Acidobacteriota bacterium]|nr:exonuclease domain-containing protein [Acidobacteriota bacterium]MDH3530014.1 exonuclease domain-containing protein [Acidobacteriota bacterium]